MGALVLRAGRKALCAAVVASLVSGCAVTATQRVEQIRTEIARELKPGASLDDVNEFLRKRDLRATWDRYNHRYSTIVRNVGWNPFVRKSIQIHLYIDDQERFVRAEVEGVYENPL